MDRINRTILYYLCCTSVGSSLFASAPRGTLARSNPLFGSNVPNVSASNPGRDFPGSVEWLRKFTDLRQRCPKTAEHLVFLHLRDPEEAQRQRVQFVADPAAAQRNEERLLEAERQRQGRYLAVLHQQIRTDTTLESKMQKGDTLDDF